MIKYISFLIIPVFFVVSMALPVYSLDSKPATNHSEHVGVMIHESTIEGYHFAYHLIDIQKNSEEMKDMKGSKEADTTHHLMVYVKDADGHAVKGAKLGYLVEGPDGAKQKLMAMGMQGAFGANANFKTKGTYTVKTKFLAGDKKLLDKFSYEVK